MEPSRHQGWAGLGWAAQGSLGACLLPADCPDLPVPCQAAHQTGWRISCPSSPPAWLLPWETGSRHPLGTGRAVITAGLHCGHRCLLCQDRAGSGPIMDAPASLLTFSHKSILFLK